MDGNYNMYCNSLIFVLFGSLDFNHVYIYDNEHIL